MRRVHGVLRGARAPREVYNLGGGRENSVSMLEAIARFEELYGRKLDWTYVDENRVAATTSATSRTYPASAPTTRSGS